MRLFLVFVALAIGLVPVSALAQGAQAYWQCRTAPVSWCPASAQWRMPVSAGFVPESGASGTIAATSSSARVNLIGLGPLIYVANIGDKEAFMAFGGSTVVATAGGAGTGVAGSMSVPSGLAVAFYAGDAQWIAAITAGADTTTLRVTRGW